MGGKALNRKRYIYIDYLKGLGLLLVILAHVNCPSPLMQVRSFDVPLLVFVSGFLASKSYSGHNAKGYYWKRIKRLVFPAWIFLTFFFFVQSIAYTKPSFTDVIKGFTFQRDSQMVGMLWVIWVYLVCALIVPIIKKIGFREHSLIFVFALLFVYEMLCAVTNLSEIRFLYITLFTIVPWGCVTYIGFYYDLMTKTQKRWLLMVFAILFCMGACFLRMKYGHFVPTNDFKYPARLYYLSYAFTIVLILMPKLQNMKLRENRVISFVSKSSLWIYLWHILILYVVKSLIENDNLWLVQYVAIVVLSVVVTLIQNLIVNKMLSKYPIDFLKVFLG